MSTARALAVTLIVIGGLMVWGVAVFTLVSGLVHLIRSCGR
jgi:hypothetical protein